MVFTSFWASLHMLLFVHYTIQQWALWDRILPRYFHYWKVLLQFCLFYQYINQSSFYFFLVFLSLFYQFYYIYSWWFYFRSLVCFISILPCILYPKYFSTCLVYFHDTLTCVCRQCTKLLYLLSIHWPVAFPYLPKYFAATSAGNKSVPGSGRRHDCSWRTFDLHLLRWIVFY